MSKLGEIEFLIELVFKEIFVNGNLFFGIFLTPFEGSCSVGLWQGIDVSELGGRRIDLIENYLVPVSDLPEDLFLFVFVSVADDVLLVFESLDGFIQPE